MPEVKSQQRLKSYQKAEEICQELRFAIATPSEADWGLITDHLVKWIQLTGKRSYKRPKWAKKGKKNA